MIRPEGFRGAAFGTAADGDPRTDPGRLAAMASALGISAEWATISQIHGDVVLVAEVPGHLGEGDAIVTAVPDLPIVVATADCVPVIVEAEGAVAVVHAGWRGLGAGTIAAALGRLRALGHEPSRAAVGPAVGPCCYEVGADVADRFGAFTTTTTWGTPSVDLGAAAEAQLAGLAVWRSGRCTLTDPDLHSHRQNGTSSRQVAVAWVPKD